MCLKDKVIPVTGSAHGMGEGMARVFVHEGARAICLAGLNVPARLIRETVQYYGADSCRRMISPAPPVYLFGRLSSRLSGGAALVNAAVIGRDPAERI
jgi:NAD(P)-dependent dehydrogenase (short-subunit alcohol dehydrogenase family)